MKRLAIPMLMLAGCCQQVEPTVEPDSFAGVRGTLHSSGGGFPTSGWVEATLPRTGEVIARAAANARGGFALALAPGSYRIEAAIDGNDFVDDIGVLEVTPEGGWYIERIYPEIYQRRVLGLVFGSGVGASRQAEILAAYQLSTIPQGDDQVVRVRTEYGVPAADVRARMLAELGAEIAEVSLNPYDCGARGDGEWPVLDASAGGGDDDGDTDIDEGWD
jgi:hypothetical protein